jgi:hypothetical protein
MPAYYTPGIDSRHNLKEIEARQFSLPGLYVLNECSIQTQTIKITTQAITTNLLTSFPLMARGHTYQPCSQAHPQDHWYRLPDLPDKSEWQL